MQINSEKHIIRANITESQLEHIKSESRCKRYKKSLQIIYW